MFNKKILSLIVITYIGVTGFISQDSDIYFKISKSIDIFGKVYKEVTLNYVDDVNVRNVIMAIVMMEWKCRCRSGLDVKIGIRRFVNFKKWSGKKCEDLESASD